MTNLPAELPLQDLEIQEGEPRADILTMLTMLTAVYKTEVSVNKLALIYQRVLGQFDEMTIRGITDTALRTHTWPYLPLPADLFRMGVVWEWKNHPDWKGDVGREDWLRARGWI